MKPGISKQALPRKVLSVDVPLSSVSHHILALMLSLPLNAIFSFLHNILEHLFQGVSLITKINFNYNLLALGIMRNVKEKQTFLLGVNFAST